MMKSLRKILKTEKENTEMTTQTDASVVDHVAALAAAQELAGTQAASLTELTAKFTELQAAQTVLTGQLEAAQAALTSVTEAKAALEAAALEVKMSARKERIVAIVGDEKAAGFLAATAGLADEAFSAVANSLAGSFAAEAQGKMFKEAGASGDVTPATAEETPLQKQLREKYHTKAA